MGIENPAQPFAVPSTPITESPHPNVPKSGFAIASLVLGLVSFFPLLGVFTGIGAIIIGIIGLSKIKKGTYSGKKLAVAGIILGILGIAFTFILYGLLFYFGFVAKNGPFEIPKKQLSEQILTQNAGYLELYKKKYGKYPTSLNELTKEGYTIFPSDHYMRPFYYKVSSDGQSYDLRSLGPDGEYNTTDDIFPKAK